MNGPDDRAQAFTLEGVVGAIIVLTAVLFALQSLIITPTTGGTVDPEIRDSLRQQGEDVLTLADSNDTRGLQWLVRYWDPQDRTFYNATNPAVGYGTVTLPGSTGTLLAETFTAKGRTFNVYLRYQGRNRSDGPGRVPVAVRGDPSDSAVVATQRVTLYDNMTLTAPDSSTVELWEYDTNATDGDDGYYPVPDAADGPVYNVVEVRLVVW
jgi:hypothetical protein